MYSEVTKASMQTDAGRFKDSGTERKELRGGVSRRKVRLSVCM